MPFDFLRKRLFELSLLTFSILLIFTPIFYYQLYPVVNNDFGVHLGWAENIYDTPQKIPENVIAHALWQWLVFITKKLFRHSWNTSALIVILSCVIASAIILYTLIRKKLSPLLSGSLAIGLLIVAPIAAFYPFDHLWYVGGYIYPNVYHNPTILLLVPLAILQFYFATETIQGKKSTWIEIFITAIISFAAAFAKPNYAICILPALGGLAFIRLIRKDCVNWKRLFFGILVPTVIILVWQFSLSFSTSSESNSQIMFVPFSVMRSFSSNLLIKFFLSITFPLLITIVYIKDLLNDVRLQLGWLGFIFGAFYTYFFAENGPLYRHGNFIFSGEISLLILFVGCVLFVVDKKFSSTNQVAKWIILSSGFLHLYFGVFFYFYMLNVSK